ncbi:hypothetical protein J6590_003629 [Homalodisca vitripennis]|nr:hypothetical protein J6590_003629 [Homalodisca vitripennis]
MSSETATCPDLPNHVGWQSHVFCLCKARFHTHVAHFGPKLVSTGRNTGSRIFYEERKRTIELKVTPKRAGQEIGEQGRAKRSEKRYKNIGRGVRLRPQSGCEQLRVVVVKRGGPTPRPPTPRHHTTRTISIHRVVCAWRGRGRRSVDAAGQGIVPAFGKMQDGSSTRIAYTAPWIATPRQSANCLWIYYSIDMENDRTGYIPVVPYRTDLELAKYDAESSKSDIESSKSDVDSSKCDIDSPKCDIESSKSDIESSKSYVDSSKCDIKSSKP